jgi:hypothetical protein
MMAGHLVKEMFDSVEFLQKRKNFDDCTDTAIALRKNLAEQMAFAVGNLATLPSKDAGMLLDALGDAAYGEFTQCVKAAIDSRLSSTASASVKKAGKASPQTILNPDKFLSPADVALARNPKVNMHVKLSVWATRLNRLGVTHPHEKTQRWWLACLILLSHAEVPMPSEIYKIVLDFKDVVEAERKIYPYGHLVHYPQSPTELNEQMLKYAYDADDQPIATTVLGLESMAKDKMVMRKNHGSLKGTKVPSSAGADAGAAHSITRADVQSIMKEERAVQARLQRIKDEPNTRGYAPMQIGSGVSIMEHSAQERQQHVKDELDARACHTTQLTSGVSIKVERNMCDQSNHAGQGHANDSRGFGHGISWGTAPARARFDFGDDVADASRQPQSAIAPKVDATGGDDGDGAESEASNDSKACLDKFSKAAIRALGKRDATRRSEKAKQKKQDAEAIAILKRPSAPTICEQPIEVAAVPKAEAAVPKTKAAVPKAKAMKAKATKANAVKAMKKPSAVIFKVPSKTAPMPTPQAGTEAPPSDYRGGRIYWKINNMAFRIIRRMPEYATERRVKWSGKKPTKANWSAALSTIDEYNAKK